MVWFATILFGSFCLFFIYGAFTFFKEGSTKGGIWLSVLSALMIIVTFLITMQERDYEDFVNKCHESHGVMADGKCFDATSVIEIKR